jgi:PPK2 family polyphosphate:nucleotide phosphotransferase
MIQLTAIPTTAPENLDKKEIREKTQRLVKRLGELQHMMYAQGKYSALVVLQGMDASGKDGAVENVFADCAPMGVDVVGFKKPTEEEFAHDFLWRVHKHAPLRGMINIFVRSHYEDILIQRVHKWITEERVEQRMQSINAFEELLAYDNHTQLFKFYLHLSKEQQAIELQQRIDDPTKHWKHNESDWRERELWPEYMRCYEYVLNRSSLPWTVVPVDQRWYRDYIIAKTMVERLEQLDLAYPALVR